MKVTGSGGSVRMRLIPAPRGTGIVGAPTSKKLLQFAGVEDCFTSTTGSTKTLENFVKATFAALTNTYSFLTPDLWPKTDFFPSPFIRYSDYLATAEERKGRSGERGGERGRGDRGRGGRGGRGRGFGGDREERGGRGGDRRGGRGFGRGRGGEAREGEAPTAGAETTPQE